MILEWKIHTSVNPFEAVAGYKREYAVHYSELKNRSVDAVHSAVIASLDKAIELIDKNVSDESKYLLIEWDVVYSILTIVVTDESKENDSSNIVKCRMVGLDEVMNGDCELSDDSWEKIVNGFAVKVREWVSNHLATSSKFSNHSLEALFHNESREYASLL